MTIAAGTKGTHRGWAEPPLAPVLELSGDRLIGWVVPRMDRWWGMLVIAAVFAGPGAQSDPALASAIESLASFPSR